MKLHSSKNIQIGDTVRAVKEFSNLSATFEVGDCFTVISDGERGFDLIHIDSGKKVTEVSSLNLEVLEKKKESNSVETVQPFEDTHSPETTKPQSTLENKIIQLIEDELTEIYGVSPAYFNDSDTTEDHKKVLENIITTAFSLRQKL